MEGQILGNRYELLEQIGAGGMAEVYKARCRMLNRFVAVKILKKEFVNDEGFVKRFKVEAQAAASLSHPNIVSVFDVGCENEINFIVMEYIDGVTLKEYITRKGTVDWKEAVRIAIQICSAIEHAHKNHIVHRDIKPHNILFTNEGIAKVTDFGIARAASFSTINMNDKTLGSVHYFSPEQARGGYTDEKSDIYSLGIVLFELVTGRLPFDGETPVSIAMKQVELQPPQPSIINPNIPTGLNDIILNALEKDKNRRYRNAGEFLSDLNYVLQNPNDEFRKIDSDGESATRILDTIDSSKLITEKLEDKILKNNNKNKEKKKRDKTTLVAVLLALLLVLPVFSYLAVKVIIPNSNGREGKEFVLADYSGRYFYDVKSMLSEKNIEVREMRKFNDKIPRDIIISQDKGKNEKILIGGYNNYIEFVVSDGPRAIKVPDLRNLDYRQAEASLNELGLKTEVVDKNSDVVAKGLVVSTLPAENQEVKGGALVTIHKSIGPEERMTMVPYLIGKTRNEAAKLIVDAKLSMGNIIPENSVNVNDKVKKQVPEPNTQLKEGSAIDLYFENVPDNTGSKVVYRSYSLRNADEYGDEIRVFIEIEQSDTKLKEVLKDEMVKKQNFPIRVRIPLPSKGTTTVRVYYDNKLYSEFIESSPGGE